MADRISQRGSRHELSRRLGPLPGLAVALLLVVAVLPSSLNLPQSNPTTTPEFAPVPPHDEKNPPPQAGNFAGVGLASTLGMGSDAGAAPAGPGLLPGAPPGRTGKTPSTKLCVGNPPRQTEDPQSPPCVAYFRGDNGGATYRGVSAEEVRVAMYVTGGGSHGDVGSRGQVDRPACEVFDTAAPPASNEPYPVEAGRIWQRYFNARYQTYGRFVHVFVAFSCDAGATTGNPETPEQVRVDAARLNAKVRPFATVVDDSIGGDSGDFITAMGQYGALSFGSNSERSRAVFRSQPGRIWSYQPSTELHAHQFASYVCTRVVPHTASFGDAADSGKPRRLGILSTQGSSPTPEDTLFARLVTQAIKACGGNIVSTATTPCAGAIKCGQQEPSAHQNMAAFKNAGVTTVIRVEGFNPDETSAATQLAFFPEWVVADDGSVEDIVAGKYYDQHQWGQAYVVTNQPLIGARRDEPCFAAAREAAPSLALSDSSIPCRSYEAFRQLFTGIQIAGPRLSDRTVDQGFHAIPSRPSSSAAAPACFYEPGDYTCVKDAVATYWDPTASSRYNGALGCYRMAAGGARYLAGQWPAGDVPSDRRSSDPCNGYSQGKYADPAPGPDSPPGQ